MQGLPSVPPAGLPGPPRRSRVPWWVMALVGGVLGLAALVGISCWGFRIYANHDRVELVDDPVVSQEAEDACAAMRAAVAANAAPPGAATEAKVRSIRAQNAAIAAMVARIRQIDQRRRERDHPIDDWLSDWEAIVDARERYARDLFADRQPRFRLPTVDGRPITDRMNSVGLDCAVSAQLLTPS